MQKLLVSALVFFLLCGNVAWAMDLPVQADPASPAWQAADPHDDPAEPHADACNHWCHGGAHLTALTAPFGLPLMQATEPRLALASTPPRATEDTPPTPPPIS